ncbi:glycosyltransferase family 39 protein [Gillisia sp. M10.2A]|uniref:Glycosyltransferase family 39 protein n=1 Tax=Gillisia lutea TaxID=2909668 RepID=A0ABS9EKV5_9FLAO|nr:glycosyltransferase family 39 protein [Gillisia lutea]MCF4102091.1 glycosyltransferase family 39 protein [Gillisia lutea]
MIDSLFRFLNYKNNAIYLLVGLGILIFQVNLDALFVNIMEARNFVSAREMITYNNWIFTTLNELPRYEKPPLPTWLSAISAAVFGIKSVFAYRLPAALTAIFLSFVFYKVQLRLHLNKSLAFMGSLILITSFYILFSGRDGQWDIFTHSFMLGSCYFLLKLIDSKHHIYKNALIAGLLFGASLLSKGPVSLYTLFLPFLISYLVIYKPKDLKVKWKALLLFILIGIVSGSWWTLLVHYYDAEAFREIAAQESSRWFNYNVRPFWYYWSFFTQSGIWTIPALISLFYWYLKTKVSNLKVYQFYLLWTLISLFLLSIIPEKKSRYLLPVLVPLAMTTAFYVEYVIKAFQHKFSKLEAVPVYLNFVILTIVAFATPIGLYIGLGEVVWEMPVTYIIFSSALIILGSCFAYYLFRKKIKQLFMLQVGMILIIISLGFPLLKLIHPSRNQPNINELKSFSTQNEIQIYEAIGVLPELVWAYGEPIPFLETAQDLTSLKEDKFGVLLQEESLAHWKEFFKDYKLEYVAHYDLNPNNAKDSNSRLTRDLYIATKKAL